MNHDLPSGSTHSVPASETTLQVPRPRLAVVSVTDPDEWASLIAQAPKPHLSQSFAYGEGKRAKGWTVKRVCLLDGDTAVAICQVLEMRVLGLRLLSRISRGPIYLVDTPSAAQTGDVYRTMRELWGRSLSPLLIAPALEATPASRDVLADSGFRRRKGRSWRSMRVDLRGTEEAIRASLSSSFRNRLRAAEKSGLCLRVANDAAAVEWMIERHVQNKRDKRFRAADGTFIRALHAAAPDDYLVFLAVVDGTPVAGMSAVRFGQVAEYHTGWFGPAGRELNAGNLLMWAAVCELKRRGCTQFDAGGLHDGHGYTQFKRGLRGSEFSLAGEWIAF